VTLVIPPIPESVANISVVRTPQSLSDLVPTSFSSLRLIDAAGKPYSGCRVSVKNSGAAKTGGFSVKTEVKELKKTLPGSRLLNLRPVSDLEFNLNSFSAFSTLTSRQRLITSTTGGKQ